MVAVGLILVASFLVVLPHLLPLSRVAPSSAAAIWLLALALRAGVVLTGAVAAIVVVPQSRPFQDLARACWHQAGLDVSGHRLADAATALPLVALALSLVWLVVKLGRSVTALDVYLRRYAKGQGPFGSTLVTERQVVLAASTLGRPRVVVSEGAVQRLDDDELTAGLAHEFGHLQRRHRPVLLLGRMFATLSRPLPASAAAERALHLSLERDADEYAVARTSDPLSLASAICKAAGSGIPRALAALRGGEVAIRLHQLVEHGGRRRSSTAVERCAQLLAAVMAAATFALLVGVSAWTIDSAVSVRAAHVSAVATH